MESNLLEFGSSVWASAVKENLNFYTFDRNAFSKYNTLFGNVCHGNIEALTKLMEFVGTNPIPDECLVFDFMTSNESWLHKVAREITQFSSNLSTEFDKFVLDNFRKLFFTGNLLNYFCCPWYVDSYGNTVFGVCGSTRNSTGDVVPVDWDDDHPFLILVCESINDDPFVRGNIGHLTIRSKVRLDYSSRSSSHLNDEAKNAIHSIIQLGHSRIPGVARVITPEEWTAVLKGRCVEGGVRRLKEHNKEDDQGIVIDMRVSRSAWLSHDNFKKRKLDAAFSRKKDDSDSEECDTE